MCYTKICRSVRKENRFCALRSFQSDAHRPSKQLIKLRRHVVNDGFLEMFVLYFATWKLLWHAINGSEFFFLFSVSTVVYYLCACTRVAWHPKIVNFFYRTPIVELIYALFFACFTSNNKNRIPNAIAFSVVNWNRPTDVSQWTYSIEIFDSLP